MLTPISRAAFREKITSMADDFADFLQDRRAADVAAIGKLHEKGVDAQEKAVVAAVHGDEAGVKDCRQGIDAGLQRVNLFTKLLQLAGFRRGHNANPPAEDAE